MCILREPRGSHKAYIRLDFLPKEHKFMLTCDMRQDA